jgi:hypothetical protein
MGSRSNVEFAETILPDGLVVQPRLKGRYGWKTGKLYGIPALVRNPTDEDRSLKGCFLGLSDDGPASCGTMGRFDVDELKPNAATETTLTVRFYQRFYDGKLGFQIDQH